MEQIPKSTQLFFRLLRTRTVLLVGSRTISIVSTMARTDTGVSGFARMRDVVSALRRPHLKPCLLVGVGNSCVLNHCSITGETIRLERILTDGEIKLIGLQPGEVKLFRVE
jgi:hypothetical protein